MRTVLWSSLILVVFILGAVADTPTDSPGRRTKRAEPRIGKLVRNIMGKSGDKTDDFGDRGDFAPRLAENLIRISKIYGEYLEHETLLPYYLKTTVDSLKYMAQSFYEMNSKIDLSLQLGHRVEKRITSLSKQFDASAIHEANANLRQITVNFNELTHIARQTNANVPGQLRDLTTQGLSAANFEVGRIVESFSKFQEMLKNLSTQAAVGVAAFSTQQSSLTQQVLRAVQSGQEHQVQQTATILQSVAQAQVQALSRVSGCSAGDGEPISLNLSIPVTARTVPPAPASAGLNLDGLDLSSLSPEFFNSLDISTLASFSGVDAEALMELIEPFGGIAEAIEAFGGPAQALDALRLFADDGSSGTTEASTMASATEGSGRIGRLLRGRNKKK